MSQDLDYLNFFLKKLLLGPMKVKLRHLWLRWSWPNVLAYQNFWSTIWHPLVAKFSNTCHFWHFLREGGEGPIFHRGTSKLTVTVTITVTVTSVWSTFWNALKFGKYFVGGGNWDYFFYIYKHRHAKIHLTSPENWSRLAVEAAVWICPQNTFLDNNGFH